MSDIKKFLLMIACMSDDEVIEYAEKYGLTPKPDDEMWPGESISNFRTRVIHVLNPERFETFWEGQ